MGERVLVDSHATITGPIFTDADETATDTTGSPTVAAVSRVTGATLTAPAVTTLTAAGAYSCELTPTAHTGDLDIIDLTWTGTVASKTRTYMQTVEVVGAFYVSLPELRTVSVLSTRDAAQLRKFRMEAEDLIEPARGTAYVHRCAVESYDVQLTGLVRLRHRHPVRLLALRIDGEAQDVADFTFDAVTRTLVPVSGRFTCKTVVEVAYVHGYASPPQLLREAVTEYVRAKAVVADSSQQRGVSSVSSLATGEVYNFISPDPRFGRWTGVETADFRINLVDDERVLIG